jgi:hypothetical protein
MFDAKFRHFIHRIAYSAYYLRGSTQSDFISHECAYTSLRRLDNPIYTEVGLPLLFQYHFGPFNGIESD